MGRLSGGTSTFKQQKISFGAKPVSTETFEVPRSKQPEGFDAYYTTQLSSVYSHYEDEVNKKRKLRAPPVRAYGTRNAAAEEALTDLEAETVSNKRRRSAGDDEGHRYLEYLWQHVSEQSVPPEIDLQRLTDLIRFHAFHGSKDLSMTALQLLQYLAHANPVTSSKVCISDNQQKNVIETAEIGAGLLAKSWSFLDRRFLTDIRHDPDQVPESAHLYFQKVWEQAALQSEFMVGRQSSDGFDPEVCYRNFGELCCLKLVLAELQRDLRHRLATYAKNEGSGARLADKRDALLQNCQLWRLLQNQSPQVRHADLILNLMRCIGASATAEDNKEEQNQNSPAMLKKQRRHLLDPSGEDDKDLQAQLSTDKSAAGGDNVAAQKQGDVEAEMDWPIDAELFGVAEMAEMAILLLQMILELCGTAEQAGFFCTTGKKARNQQTKYECTRVKLDRFMIEGLVGAKEVLKTVPEKSSFLQCLHAKDCLRLLGMTVGSRLSISNEIRYPVLAQYRAIHSGSRDIDGFLNVDPSSILECIPDMPYHQAKLIHKEGSLDSLALLTAVTVQSALSLQMAGGLPKLLTKLLAFFQSSAHGSDKTFVSNNSWALLAAASCAIVRNQEEIR